MKVRIHFKDPDVIHEILEANHPLPDDEEEITPRMEKQREDFSKKYFEYGDYGRIEIDTETMTGRILPRKEWK
jgi:hypothetical protein